MPDRRYRAEERSGLKPLPMQAGATRLRLPVPSPSVRRHPLHSRPPCPRLHSPLDPPSPSFPFPIGAFTRRWRRWCPTRDVERKRGQGVRLGGGNGGRLEGENSSWVGERLTNSSSSLDFFFRTRGWENVPNELRKRGVLHESVPNGRNIPPFLSNSAVTQPPNLECPASLCPCSLRSSLLASYRTRSYPTGSLSSAAANCRIPRGTPLTSPSTGRCLCRCAFPHS